MTMDDGLMKKVLLESKVIAVVGHSDKPNRTSYRIAQYMRDAGYTIYAVNPTVDMIDGEKSYPTLADVPEKIDIVNVFRRSEFLLDIVKESIAIDAQTVWAQLDVYSPIAATTARNAGVNIVMNRCIKIEHLRLGIPVPH